ncbi:hypothetical protein [Sorangium cellulosum]|uniref:Uncharacterized protein n=1 Tax=Sorangium cellulosum So0157-2 TaxID=1254432 RepID=S4Y9C6_SORCE|nr:hypothetical protein [Sorangium cellulosum]AGP41489.1 hypothetical protein SCE1572_47605 [Sorangium cellulosum So0157-2]
MPIKYHLKNPKNNNDILVQNGQSWDEPIYKATQSNDYFLLRMDGDGGRSLVEFDVNTGQCSGSATRVPDNWQGEPVVMGMEQSTYDNLLDMCDRGDLVSQQVWADLVRRMVDGDILRITENGRTVASLVVERRRDGLELVRR